MIPYGGQSTDKKELDAIKKVFKSGWMTQGPAGRDFEDKIAKMVGARYGLAVANGTAALHVAYAAAGLKKGDEVITTPNTFAATANMLLALGVKPIFCDIRLDTYNIDETKIEKLITKKTKAIVPVHFAGHPCEMNAIWRIAKKHKLLVIEDAAQALGAKYRGKYIGGGKSDTAMYSFHPTKAITTAEGGMLVTKDKAYYEKMLKVRNHGIAKDKDGFNVMDQFGFNYRMSDVHASIGLAQLPKLKGFLKKRHQMVKQYYKELKDVDGIVLPVELKDVYSGWHLFVIRTVKKKDRMPLYRYLQQNEIGVNFHFPAIYRHPYYRKNGYRGVKLENADLYHETAMTLPLHVNLTQKQIKYISKTIKDYFN